MKVQLFATCLGDLVFPDAVADAEALLRRGRARGRLPAAAGLLRPARVQLGPPRGGARVSRARSRGRSRVSCRSSARRARARRWSSTTCPSSSASSRSTSTSSPRFLGRAPPLPRTNEGRTPRLPRLVPHAARAADLGRAAAAARGGRRDLVPLAAPRPLLRLRRHVLGAPAGDLARDGRRQARRRGRRGADALVTADPGCLMHLRGRAARSGAPAGRPPRDCARAGDRRMSRARPATPHASRERARHQTLADAVRARRSSTRRRTGSTTTASRPAWGGARPDVEALRETARRDPEPDDRRARRATSRRSRTPSRRAAGTSTWRRDAPRRRATTSPTICRPAGAKLVAKSKSMATRGDRASTTALDAAGVRPVETDLGEYVLQLAGAAPGAHHRAGDAS